MLKMVLIVFVALGAGMGLSAKSRRVDWGELLPIGGVCLLLYAASVGCAFTAKRRESGRWLGMDPKGWVITPILAFVGGIACAFYYAHR